MILRGLLGFKEQNQVRYTRTRLDIPVILKANRRLSILGKGLGKVNHNLRAAGSMNGL
jgi:hypothetical protein